MGIRSLAAGRRSIDAFRFTGDVFGFDDDGERQFSALAISNVSVRVARRDAVFLRAAADRDASQELLAASYQELQRAQRRALRLSMNARQRIASFLLEMSERLCQPDNLELPMARQDIADYLGLTIETVSRTFTQLDRACVIGSRTSRYVALLDSPALRLIIDERREGGYREISRQSALDTALVAREASRLRRDRRLAVRGRGREAAASKSPTGPGPPSSAR
jgi:CRP/FNR family nitrogen fixation transcriptional regulator